MRQIIILETPPSGNPDTMQVSGVFWLTVPTNNQRWHANPNATSIVPNIISDELDMLKAGQIIEQEFHLGYPATYTAQQIVAELDTRFASAQATVTNDDQHKWMGIYRDENNVWYTPDGQVIPL